MARSNEWTHRHGSRSAGPEAELGQVVLIPSDDPTTILVSMGRAKYTKHFQLQDGEAVRLWFELDRLLTDEQKDAIRNDLSVA